MQMVVQLRCHLRLCRAPSLPSRAEQQSPCSFLSVCSFPISPQMMGARSAPAEGATALEDHVCHRGPVSGRHGVTQPHTSALICLALCAQGSALFLTPSVCAEMLSLAILVSLLSGMKRVQSPDPDRHTLWVVGGGIPHDSLSRLYRSTSLGVLWAELCPPRIRM